MFKIICEWILNIAIFLLVALFLTWLYKTLGGSIFLIIILILLLERSINRTGNQLKGLQERNTELERKYESLSGQMHELKNKINDKF